MSVRSTMYLRRSEAFEEVVKNVAGASDRELAEILQIVLGERARFLNFRIVENPEDFDKRYERGIFND
jgi:hypothetical protein